MSTTTLTQIVDDAIKQRAEAQAQDERFAFEDDVRAALAKHGITQPYAAMPVIATASRSFVEARAAMLMLEARAAAAQRILGENWGGGGSKVEPN
ncbi:hypothetical protein H0A73_17420 [Alcaligenaceae bacterium]|nr:hypothetical protein [Alcaligenaceae bacterium]